MRLISSAIFTNFIVDTPQQLQKSSVYLWFWC